MLIGAYRVDVALVRALGFISSEPDRYFPKTAHSPDARPGRWGKRSPDFAGKSRRNTGSEPVCPIGLMPLVAAAIRAASRACPKTPRKRRDRDAETDPGQTDYLDQLSPSPHPRRAGGAALSVSSISPTMFLITDTHEIKSRSVRSN